MDEKEDEKFEKDAIALRERFTKSIMDYYPEGINYINLGSIVGACCSLMISTIQLVDKKYSQFKGDECLNHLSDMFKQTAQLLKKNSPN